MCQRRCQTSPPALIHLPCKTAVGLQESWILKERTWWLSLQAQQGAWLPGPADGGFRRNRNGWIWKKSEIRSPSDSKAPRTAGRRHFSAWPSLRWRLLPLFTVSKAASFFRGWEYWPVGSFLVKNRWRFQHFRLSILQRIERNVTFVWFRNKMILGCPLASACNHLLFNRKDKVTCKPLLGRMSWWAALQ